MGLLASAMPNESELRKEHENLWHPQREEGHAHKRRNHHWNRREGLTHHRRKREPEHHTPGPRSHWQAHKETRAWKRASPKTRVYSVHATRIYTMHATRIYTMHATRIYIIHATRVYTVHATRT